MIMRVAWRRRQEGKFGHSGFAQATPSALRRPPISFRLRRHGMGATGNQGRFGIRGDTTPVGGGDWSLKRA
jgi:hypothetical protein